MTDDQPPVEPEEYPLSPEAIDEEVEAREKARELLEKQAAEVETLEEADEARFSLAWMFVLMTGVAVILALGRQVRPEIFAGVCGAGVLISLAVISVLRIRWVVIHVAWWLLLAIYLLASAMAVNRGQ